MRNWWLLAVRGFCPSCGARRMADSAALLVDEVLPHQPMRQWVLSVPFPLRFLFASNPKAMTGALGTVYRAISTHLAHKAGFAKPMAQTGAVTLIQCFGGALNAHILCGAPHKMFRTEPLRGGSHHLILCNVAGVGNFYRRCSWISPPTDYFPFKQSTPSVFLSRLPE